MFTEQFIQELHEAFPEFVITRVERGDVVAGRVLDDNTTWGISYKEILAAKSLEEIQAKARKIALQNKVYADFRSGRCYKDVQTKRKQLGCPRLYAQQSNDEAVLDAFSCTGVSHIPQCPKFCTGECWKKFDELGLQMQ